MSDHSVIEWTDATWNPVTGCTKISPGCAHCYAERNARWLHSWRNPRYLNGFTPTRHDDVLEKPLHWKRPRTIFVNSMSDTFHEDIPDEFIERMFDVMGKADWHVFQILTKRTERMVQLAPRLSWKSYMWQGVTVENAAHLQRVEHLQQIQTTIRFLSLEPLIGPIPLLPLAGIHWVIVGGESGPGHRSMDPAWVRELRDQCVAAGVPFFFKQWGGPRPTSGGRLLDGRTWDQIPSMNGSS